MEVSVVIPFYNAEATLERAIESVINQEGVALQILLIDNNSSDRSSEIAKSYVDQFEHISLHKELKQGANHARNLGLLMAKNDWIQYLDADDELLPNKIGNQLSINRLTDIDIISSPITELAISGKRIKYQVSEMGDIWLSLLHGKIGWTCSNLWRKSALVDVGGWNVDYSSHQEVELMSRLIMGAKKFFFYNKMECVVHEQEVSISKNANFPLTGIHLMKQIEEYFLSNDILTKERKKAIHTQLYHKSLMAYKVDSESARDVMFGIGIDTHIIDLPVFHQLLNNLLGMQNSFRILKMLSRS